MEPDELKKHLEVSSGRFDVTAIYDRSGYSPLHFAAYKDSFKMCQILCEFVLTNNHTSERLNYSPKEVLKRWINSSSKGDEGFTALHFASFHGNMQLIKYLISMGASAFAHNKQDINMLHVAAQGD